MYNDDMLMLIILVNIFGDNACCWKSCIMVYEFQSSFGEPWSYGGDRVRVADFCGNWLSVTYGDVSDFGVLWLQEGICSYGGDLGAMNLRVH